MGCDHFADLPYAHGLVSIHAPVWGATPMIRRIVGVDGVSIHAPVWGATVVCFGANHAIDVSIHAPVWGATTLRS